MATGVTETTEATGATETTGGRGRRRGWVALTTLVPRAVYIGASVCAKQQGQTLSAWMRGLIVHAVREGRATASDAEPEQAAPPARRPSATERVLAVLAVREDGTVPRLPRRAIARAVGLSDSYVNAILHYLKVSGMVEFVHGAYALTPEQQERTRPRAEPPAEEQLPLPFDDPAPFPLGVRVRLIPSGHDERTTARVGTVMRTPEAATSGLPGALQPHERVVVWDDGSDSVETVRDLEEVIP